MSTESPEQLNVTIAGRDYLLSCAPAEKDALLAAVAYVDDKMLAVRQHSKLTGNDRVAVLAALNITNELLSVRASLGENTDLAFNEFKRRIQSINAALDHALAPQEKLF